MSALSREQLDLLAGQIYRRNNELATRDLVLMPWSGFLTERCCGRILRWDEVRGPEGRLPCRLKEEL